MEHEHGSSHPERSLADALLSQQEFPSDRFTQYQKEVQAMLDANERGLKREKWGAMALWLWVVALAVLFLILGGLRPNTPLAAWFASNACLWVLFGAVELLKHFINRSRVSILKEIKQLELQVVELREALRQKTA
jgi:hypothetical protein